MKTYFDKRIEDELDNPGIRAFSRIYKIKDKSRVRYWLIGILLGLVIILFIPWTQNIRGTGSVTTLKQEDRPQQLNSIIPGKIVKWNIREGEFVNAGDTIIQLSEVKDDYLDPALLSRTREQLTSKEMSVESYINKAGAADKQISALLQGQALKISQVENKISQQKLKLQSDSMEMQAAMNDFSIAGEQFRRQKLMYDSGLVSLTQLEQRNLIFQNANAKKASAEIKFINAKQELLFLQLELNGAVQDYNEKISKASGDKYQSLSQIASGKADIAKLENQYMNYDIRSNLYYITAPQSGQVIKAKKAGIGEIVKEGEMIVEIVPDSIQYAVEMFVKPLDLPLIVIGQKVRFMFDGFPAVVFSGWPAASYGTFGGKVTAIESSLSYNGKFRILVAEDKNDRPWPKQLRMGAGAQGMALLKNVPIWYEVWRNINGFPPEYYTGEIKTKKEDKK